MTTNVFRNSHNSQNKIFISAAIQSETMTMTKKNNDGDSVEKGGPQGHCP